MIGLCLHDRRLAGALPRRRGLRTGLVLRRLRAARHRQYGAPGGGQPPAGDHRAGRADDELPDRGTDFPQHLAAVAGAHRHGARGAHGFVASAAADLCRAHRAGRHLAAIYHRGRTRTQRAWRRGCPIVSGC